MRRVAEIEYDQRWSVDRYQDAGSFDPVPVDVQKPFKAERLVFSRRRWKDRRTVEPFELRDRIRDAARLTVLEEVAGERIVEGMIDLFAHEGEVVLSCPATWWDHLKYALRTRWPKLWGWLPYRRRVVRSELLLLADGVRDSDRHHMFMYSFPVEGKTEVIEDVEPGTL